jgi:hypothetical protein
VCHPEESFLPDSLTAAHLKQALKHRWLAERLARIHVNYESEWYAEIKADGTIPKWEIAAESQQELGLIKACLTEETPHAAQHYQQYLINEQGQSEPQANAYLHGLNATRNDRQQKNAVLACIKEMESNWQLSQTQIKSLLWWSEVAQKLADKQAKDSDKDAANTASQPATLDPQGRAWFMHPLSIISNSYGSKISIIRNYSLNDAKEALRIIYNNYGKDIAIIERMYRSETRHFKSKQYMMKTGTGGMESFGKAPYYGWDADFFSKNPQYIPIGLTHLFEDVGLSQQGGDQQIKDKPKKFIIFPSVLAAMKYKVFYIKKYNGNYARWHSTNPKA